MQAASMKVSPKRIAMICGALVVILVILWLDISTGIWQEVVVLSGLAAGLVTFLLTVLVLDRVLAKSAARRWAPVNRLAYSEFLHALADDETSELSRGEVQARALPLPKPGIPLADFHEYLLTIRALVVSERRALADTLSRWAQFLASSGDNELVLRHIAAIAWQLDLVRDATLEAERDRAAEPELRHAIASVNAEFVNLVAELTWRLSTETDDPAGR